MQQLVIFDCDGVLVDSEPISNRVLAEMLGEEGLPMTPQQARREYQGLLLREVVARAERALGRPLPDGWQELYEERRDVAFARDLRAVADAERAVAAVRAAGLGACVASQGRLRKTRHSLAVTGLSGLFDEQELFSAESVARGKPHPDLFLHAARSMGSNPVAERGRRGHALRRGGRGRGGHARARLCGRQRRSRRCARRERRRSLDGRAARCAWASAAR